MGVKTVEAGTRLEVWQRRRIDRDDAQEVEAGASTAAPTEAFDY